MAVHASTPQIKGTEETSGQSSSGIHHSRRRGGRAAAQCVGDTSKPSESVNATIAESKTLQRHLTTPIGSKAARRAQAWPLDGRVTTQAREYQPSTFRRIGKEGGGWTQLLNVSREKDKSVHRTAVEERITKARAQKKKKCYLKIHWWTFRNA